MAHTNRSHDFCTASNLTLATTIHTELLWFLDMDARSIRGQVLHVLRFGGDRGLWDGTLFLDNKGLSIESVVVEYTTGSGFVEAGFQASGTATAAFGTPLRVTLDATRVPSGRPADVVLRVAYSVPRDGSAALDWLSAEQTLSRASPFLYSQSEPINARALFPCQDSPQVRMTYSATVVHAANITVLMSALVGVDAARAEQEGALPRRRLTDYAVPSGHVASFFAQPQRVTPYLVAIAAGTIAARDLSPRCRVYAEPELVEKAAAEFEDIETLLATAEKIAGRYRWGRSDLLVLPPSFPYGGMENPNLIFVSPSIVCGDKSGIDVVAHEICHSWSGNLVGTASWSDFFLNEGFTVLLQRKISKALYGRPFSEFEGISGRRALEDTVRTRGASNAFTALRPDLSGGADPEDVFSTVPYEKGYALLRHMEQLVGEDEEYDRWLIAYFDHFAGQSITGYDMKAHFLQHYAAAGRQPSAEIDWERWFNEPGLPPVEPQFDASARRECSDLAALAVRENHAALSDASHRVPSLTGPVHWRGTQRAAFLEDVKSAFFLPDADPISVALLDALDGGFGFSSAERNSEVRCEWYQLCLLHQCAASTASRYSAFLEPMKAFLAGIGRMKYLRPLYRAWFKVDSAASVEWFTQCASKYHAIARKMLRGDLQMTP